MLRLTDKMTISLSALTFVCFVSTVASGAWFVGGKYENWDNWRSSVMQFIRDQRTDTAEIQATLEDIKRQLAVQHADAR